jgi:hypothetical protein
MPACAGMTEKIHDRSTAYETKNNSFLRFIEGQRTQAFAGRSGDKCQDVFIDFIDAQPGRFMMRFYMSIAEMQIDLL